ncbi:MAG TPA: T9SS type A sorting domain-containing protein [Bacteroidales bacterium]|nr:T9SS type A sorting domain-containing protein [Bacteroidales bacterium]HPM91919.1 T9SS type A sorting domain-containing protein [Bacteroidales bacterium]
MKPKSQKFASRFTLHASLLFLALCPVLLATGQNHKWYYNYNTGKSEEGKDIVCGSDGYIYIAGTEYDEADYDIIVIKLDKSGNQQWVYSYEGQPDKTMVVAEIQAGSDGNIYVCGTANNAEDNNKFLVISINPEGGLRWEYIYDVDGNYPSEAFSVAYGGNGMVYAAGKANYDFLVAGINAGSGEQEWIYWFDGGCPYALCDDQASAITVGNDGNIYAAGYTHEATEPQLTILSLTPEGSKNWKYLFPFSEGRTWATDIVYGDDGRIYASGLIYSNIAVICVDATGQYQWNCNVDGPGPEPYWGETCYELIYGFDNNIYVTGRAGGRDNQVDTDMDVAVIKVDLQGSPVWFYRYEGLYGDHDMAFSITQTPDTNVHVAGYFCGLLAEAGTISLDHRTGRDLWVMRYVGPAIDMDVAYAITSDDDGYLYVTGYDFKANRLHDVYAWKLQPPKNTDGFYNLEGYATWGEGHSVLETPDKGFLIAGYQGSSMTSSTYNMRLIKTDINGDTLWTRNYGGNNEERAFDVAICPDNGYILTGFTKSFGAGGKDLYIVRTDENGNMQWEKTYGIETDEEGYSIVTATDGGYFIAGKTYQYDGAGDLWFMKINAQGDSLWTKRYGGDRRDEVGEVHRTADGGYIFAGTRGHALTLGYITDIYAIRFDAAGDTIWTREIGSEDYWDAGGDILEQDDGTFLLVGYYLNKEYIAKLDADGKTLWEKTSETEQNGGFTTISKKPDGNILLSRNGFGSQYLMNVRTYDTEGNFISSDTMGWSPGYVLYPTTALANDAQPTSGGGYVAVGKGNIAGNANNWNIVLYRKGGTLTMLPLPPLGIKELPFINTNHKTQPAIVSPNPVNDQAIIGFTLSSQEHAVVEITDIAGRIVYKSEPRYFPEGDGQFELNNMHMRNGLYNCRIIAGNEIFTGKFIILKNY